MTHMETEISNLKKNPQQLDLSFDELKPVSFIPIKKLEHVCQLNIETWYIDSLGRKNNMIMNNFSPLYVILSY